ncbi:MAG: hypothetical protein NUV49_03535 [Patescibacteria group bacterium]|nr:hypothetical protein [Patescibacteria group bacterium]
MKTISLAGVDALIREMRETRSRVIQRENVEYEGQSCIKLTELHDGEYLICIAPPKFASRCLMGWIEELELKEER